MRARIPENIVIYALTFIAGVVVALAVNMLLNRVPAPAVVEKPNSITESFASKGVKQCSARINQVSNFLGANSAGAGAFLFLPEAEADQQLSSLSMEIIGKDNKSAYISSSFAPLANGSCQASYDAVAYFSEKCDAVIKHLYAKQKDGIGKLKQNVSIVPLNTNSRVFLMAAGDGCVSIKKETVYK